MPGIYTEELVEAWKHVVKAVHNKGAIFSPKFWYTCSPLIRRSCWGGVYAKVSSHVEKITSCEVRRASNDIKTLHSVQIRKRLFETVAHVTLTMFKCWSQVPFEINRETRESWIRSLSCTIHGCENEYLCAVLSATETRPRILAAKRPCDCCGAKDESISIIMTTSNLKLDHTHGLWIEACSISIKCRGPNFISCKSIWGIEVLQSSEYGNKMVPFPYTTRLENRKDSRNCEGLPNRSSKLY